MDEPIFVLTPLPSANLSDPYLEHYGVIGMRWGVIRTPEQLGHPPAGGKDYKAAKGQDPNAKDKKTKSRVVGKRSSPNKSKTRKQLKQEKEEAAKAAKEKKRRDAILKDPRKLYKHKEEFTKEEIQKAMDNFRMDQQLSQMAASKRRAGQERVESVVNAVGTASKGLSNSISLYNNVARIYNTFEPDENKHLKLISTDDKKKRRSSSGSSGGSSSGGSSSSDGST